MRRYLVRTAAAAMAVTFGVGMAQARDIVLLNISNTRLESGAALFDKDSIVAAGNVRRFTSYIFIKAADGNIRGVNLTEVDCASGRIRYVDRRLYQADHSLYGALSEPTRWERIRPDSDERRMFDVTCGKSAVAPQDDLGDRDPLAFADQFLGDIKAPVR